jgi:hypothetical protein
MRVTARRWIVVWGLVGLLRLLEMDALLVLGIVTVVLVEFLASTLGIDGPRGRRASAVLRRRRVVRRRRASHPAGSPERRKSLATAATGVASRNRSARDQRHEQTS